MTTFAIRAIYAPAFIQRIENPFTSAAESRISATRHSREIARRRESERFEPGELAVLRRLGSSPRHEKCSNTHLPVACRRSTEKNSATTPGSRVQRERRELTMLGRGATG